MSEVVTKEFKKSSINANSDFDFYSLQRKSNFLIDCKINRTLDQVIFQFEYNHEQDFSNLREMPLVFKYQVLINVKNLIEDSKRIKISLSPNNLVFDSSMMPKAVMRDVYKETKFDENDFVSQYKALIGYLLQNKYSFSDFYEGGNQLLLKSKSTSAYVDLMTTEEIINKLTEEYEKLQERIKTRLIEVDKRKYKQLEIAIKLSSVLLLFSIIAIGYFAIFRLPEEKTFNKANQGYINQDYITVKDTLSDIKISRMDKNTKYILAVSNVKTESLNDEQKNNILSSVSINSDDRILDFWIYLGKSNTEKAIDVAKQLGNKEYIAYAYMKEKVLVESDTSLSGAEREQKLKEIENSLKEFAIDLEEDT